MEHVDYQYLQKSFMTKIEMKQHHELSNAAQADTKALVLAFKSSKANCLFQRQIGPNIKGKCTMNDDTFGVASKLHRGINVRSMNAIFIWTILKDMH